MDALLPPLCLLLGIALPGALLYFLARRGWRQTAAPAAYRQVARELHLDVDTRGASVNGYLAQERRRLYIGEVMVGHGRERRFEHRAMLTLTRPLALGLAIRRRTGRRWFRRARGHVITTGDEEFDKRFLVTGDDTQAVQALIDPAVRERILSVSARHPDLLVSDHGVRFLLKRPATEPAAVHAIIAELRGVAEGLKAARGAGSPPDPLAELVPALADIAKARALTLDTAWPAVTGHHQGLSMAMMFRRDDGGYSAQITAWFNTPTDLGLRLRRQTEPDGYWSVGQDIQVDDPAFDDAFVIKGYAPDAIRARLTAPARAQLLALADLGDVVVDDHLVNVGHVALEPDTLRAAVDRVVAAAAALESRG